MWYKSNFDTWREDTKKTEAESKKVKNVLTWKLKNYFKFDGRKFVWVDDVDNQTGG